MYINERLPNFIPVFSMSSSILHTPSFFFLLFGNLSHGGVEGSVRYAAMTISHLVHSSTLCVPCETSEIIRTFRCETQHMATKTYDH